MSGQIHPVDSARAVDWYHTITADLKDNLLKDIKPKASETRGGTYKAGNVTDGNWIPIGLPLMDDDSALIPVTCRNF